MSRTRKALIVLALAPLVAGLAFVLGPRRVVDTRVAAAALPESLAELEASIAARAAALGDVTSGCAAAIAWADPAVKARTPVSLVYLHGFSATRQETAPLTRLVAAELKANAFEVRLRGHGRSGEALGDAKVEEWLADAAEALAIGRRLGEQVVVIACSTGASLATVLLAQGDTEGIAGLVLISPNYRPRHRGAALLSGPWGAQLCRLVAGPERSWTPSNELQGRFWTTRYPSQVLVEMGSLVRLANEADLSALKVPLLLLYSPDDKILDSAAMVQRFEDAGSPIKERVEVLDDSDPVHHVLAGDVLSPNTTASLCERIVGFLRPVVKVP